MEKEENQNSTSSDQNQDIAKESEKPEESSDEERDFRWFTEYRRRR